jgi:hypothetical protein
MKPKRLLIIALFLVIIAVALWVPFYNRTTPTLAGLPFFYWFQAAWIVVGAVVVAIAGLVTRDA